MMNDDKYWDHIREKLRQVNISLLLEIYFLNFECHIETDWSDQLKHGVSVFANEK